MNKPNNPYQNEKNQSYSDDDLVRPRKNITRKEALKNILTYLAAAATVGPFISCSSKSDTGGPPVLTSGYIPILDCVPIIVAYAQGIFEEYGVNAEKPVLIRSWPALTEAFTSKQILLTHILLPQVIFLRYAQKIPLRSVAYNHTNVVAMLRAKGISKTSDLGGKAVGCPTWWAPHTGIFQDVLREVGLKPVVGKSENELAPDEVAFRVIPPPDMPEGLKSGKIAGCTVSEPFGAASEVLAEATLIKMSGDVWLNHPCCQSVLLQETLDRDPEWAQAVTNSIYKATLWAKENREELANLLGKDGGGYFPMPIKIMKRALLAQDLETYGPAGTGAIMHPEWNVKRVDFYPYPYPSAFEVTVKMMKRMVVDQSAAMPPEIRSLTGRQVAADIVDYKLAQTGFNAAGGVQAFGGIEALGVKSTDPFEREERYEVLVKTEELATTK